MSFNLFHNECTPHFFPGIKCYDGGTQLYLPEVLTKDELIVNTTHPNDNSPVRIIVTLKKKMTLKECGALYNILFKNCAKVLKFARLGRETYDFRQSYHIPQHKLEVWPGENILFLHFLDG